MLNHKNKKSEQGFALMLSIFLVIGVSLLMVGNLMQTMRQKREINRAVSETRLAMVADSLVDRGLRLFQDYMTTSNGYPTTDADLIVKGDDYAPLGGKTFSEWLSFWYMKTFKSKFEGDFETGLSRINVYPGDIIIRQIGKDASDEWRRYSIEVTASSDASKVQRASTQEVKINRGRLFNFSIFSNEVLEITPGPDLEMQGPIFSNKDIYLMTDTTSTLKLKKANNFSSPSNPEPYVISSAGNIYYYFQRSLGINYLMKDYPSSYRVSQLPSYYRRPDYMQIDTFTGSRLEPTGESATAFIPHMYFFQNVLDHGNADLYNLIKIETSVTGSYTTMDHTNYSQNDPSNSKYLRGDTKYKLSGFMNYSGAVKAGDFPSFTAAPEWTPRVDLHSSSPSVNPNWLGIPSDATYKDRAQGVSARTIPIGDPSNPAGAHVLIEPLTSIFNVGHIATLATVEDTEDVKQSKFQTHADLNIYWNDAIADRKKRVSQDFQDLLDGPGHPITGNLDGHLVQSGSLAQIYDYRFGISSSGAKVDYPINLIELDLAKLWSVRDDLFTKPEGVVIYIHVYPISADPKYPKAVRIINGTKTPKGGLTIVTNGRLYIQGDYNTFNYNYCDASDISAACYCTHASRLTDWANHDCHVPSTAIFSDSVVLLSKHWKKVYGRDSIGHLSGPIDRRVFTDMMVNTAFGTGQIPSQLVKTHASFPGAKAPNNFSYPLCGVGTLWYLGISAVTPACEYYRDPSTLYYYINRCSTNYINNGKAHGLPDPGGDCRDPRIKIPVFIHEPPPDFVPGTPDFSKLKPAIANHGYRYWVLNRPKLMTEATSVCTAWSCPASPYSSSCCAGAGTRGCPGVPGDVCHDRNCAPASGETRAACTGCITARSCTSSVTVPAVAATYTYDLKGDMDLYTTKYSGGLENLTDLLESWAGRNLRLSGTLSIVWPAKELKTVGAPASQKDAFWRTAYYAAPKRIFQFNEDFQTDPPPATPGIFSIKREKTK